MSRVENALPIPRIKTQNAPEFEHTRPEEELVEVLPPETLATLEQQVAAIQQLFSATGIAVGMGSAGTMRCVLQRGVGAPALGSDLCQVPTAADAMSSNLAVIGTADGKAQIAVPAVGGHEPAVLLILVADKTDAFDKADLSLLYACVDHLADLVTPTPISSSAATDQIRLRLIENAEPVESLDDGIVDLERWDLPTANSVPPADPTSSSQSLDDIGIYFDAPADAPPDTIRRPVPGEAPDEECVLFDDLSNEGAQQPASSPASEVSVHLHETPVIASMEPAPSPATSENLRRQWRPWILSLTSLGQPQARFAAGILLLALAASVGFARMATNRGARPHAAILSANSSQSSEATPVAFTSDARPPVRTSKSSRRTESPRRDTQAKTPRDQIAKADVVVESERSKLDIQAYEGYVIAAEAGDLSAKKQAQALTRKIPANKIAEVREHIGQAFQYSVGVPQDLHKAAMWYSLAVVAGSKDAKRQLEALRSEMSDTDLRSAQADANSWLTRHAANSNKRGE